MWIIYPNQVFIPQLVERGLYCNHLVRPSVCPSVHTFVTDISASTRRNDFIFDIWLWYGDLYRVSPFQVYHTSTSCLQCDLEFLLVEKTGVPRENHRPVASYRQTLSHNVVLSTPYLSRIRTHNTSGDRH